jgi:cytoskeletal protein RodZ
MALFRRNKQTEETTDAAAMPPELQDYYQSETRQRGWMAWVLGLTTLVVTVLVALGLFYGGRYVYRKIRGNDKPVATNQQANQATDQAENKDSQESKDTSPDSSSSSTPAATTPAPSRATSSASTSTPQPATTQSSNLPGTGPENTIAVFVVVSLLAYLAHRRLLA